MIGYLRSSSVVVIRDNLQSLMMVMGVYLETCEDKIIEIHDPGAYDDAIHCLSTLFPRRPFL
jgi:hypothetical protein